MMNSNDSNVTPEDRRLYMEIKNRLERDPNITSNLKYIVSRYEDIKPRTAERITNVTELIFELEQRCTIRYVSVFKTIWGREDSMGE